MAKKKLYTRTLTLPDGTRKYFRATTKAAADEKLLAAKIQLRGGVDLTSDLTFAQLAQIWYDAFKRNVLRDKSLDTIRGTLNRYILPTLGPKKVKDIKPFDIQMVMRNADGLAKSTQQKILNVLRPIFQLAEDNGMILKSPVVSSIEPTGKEPKPQTALTDAQVRQLLDAVKDTRAYPFVLLALYAGLRRGEALGVMWSDFDFNTGVLHVQRSIAFSDNNPQGLVSLEMKTSAAHRDIPLPLPVLEYFRTAAEHKVGEFVVCKTNGEHLSESGMDKLWSIVRRRSTAYGDSPRIKNTFDFEVHPHQLRHTCVTNWIRSGLDIKAVQYLAGHATVQMTLDVYTHYDQEARYEETAKKIQENTVELPEGDEIGCNTGATQQVAKGS